MAVSFYNFIGYNQGGASASSISLNCYGYNPGATYVFMTVGNDLITSITSSQGSQIVLLGSQQTNTSGLAKTQYFAVLNPPYAVTDTITVNYASAVPYPFIEGSSFLGSNGLAPLPTIANDSTSSNVPGSVNVAANAGDALFGSIYVNNSVLGTPTGWTADSNFANYFHVYHLNVGSNGNYNLNVSSGAAQPYISGLIRLVQPTPTGWPDPGASPAMGQFNLFNNGTVPYGAGLTAPSAPTKGQIWPWGYNL